jgi:MoaA/NifB/PqqE/SkfB family radical SAM enzyme
MIRIAAEQPLYTSLFTNGVLLEQCSNAILTSGLSALNISVHTLEGNTQLAADPAALNTNKELSAIACLSSQCASMHIRTSICVMITRKNYSSMKDIITMGEKLGVDVVRLMAILPSEAASPDTVGSWDDQEIRDFFIKDILPLRPSVDVVMPKFLKNRTRIKTCQELFLYLKFSVSGDTYPCCYLPLVQSYGNVFTEDFDWNSDIYITARAKMREGNKLTNRCMLCPHSSSTNIQYNRLLRRWTGLIKFC